MTQSLNRRDFLKQAGAAALALSGARALAAGAAPAKPLNLLLITADDMWWNTPGCFGGKAPGITPNLDRLAAEGMRFNRAHVTVAVCQPSRSVMMTGRYPHHNGAKGFEPIRADVPTLTEALHNAGYLNGILGKVIHLQPKAKFFWDMEHDQQQLGNGRNPDSYYQYTREFFDRAKAEGKPFFLMANSHDPHRPFWTNNPAVDQPDSFNPKPKAPARIYTPEEVPVPGFLPDLPEVRREMAYYHNSARRCDETVGMVLRALKEAGLEENTLVMFLSDNGISEPFAKSNNYFNSTRTPWIVRWPGKVRPGRVENEHFISGIDLAPTMVAAAGLPPLAGADGASFVPLLLGQPQAGREFVFTQYHRTSGQQAYPMRCVQNGKYGYIYNFWADGQRQYRSEPMGGLAWKAMKASNDPAVARRADFNIHRVPEEFYDLESDPDCLRNLVADADAQAELARFRELMVEFLKKTGDPALEAYKDRNNPAALAAFMAAEEAKAGPQGPARQGAGNGKKGMGKGKGKGVGKGKGGRKAAAAATPPADE